MALAALSWHAVFEDGTFEMEQGPHVISWLNTVGDGGIILC